MSNEELKSSSRSIPTNGDFRCPACRARQPVQDVCRRCRADLTLLAKIYRRIDYLINNPAASHEEELALLIAADRGTPERNTRPVFERR